MPIRPPVPPVPHAHPPLRAFLRAVRTNALTMWPEAAYREEVSVRQFMGRANVTLNGADAIHHVLIGNAGNYRRSPASIRILRPITGNGLLLSEGEEWKLQRRTIAPALAPRVLPVLARHILTAADQAVVRLQEQAGQPIDLLTTMQNLALEIAGRSMFSLEMAQHGAALRRLMDEFSHHSRPYALDMLLPPSIPTPHDWGRIRFRKRWMGFIRTLIADRLAEPEPDVPRDLFDLLRAARDPETGARFAADQLCDQVATMILAGHETTGVTLFWALLLLAQATEEQAWLAEEAASVSLHPDTALGVMAGMHRTRAVVNETLRLFPPVFVIVREVIAADRIGTLELPRRTVVMIAPWLLHRHLSHWQEPDAFVPARFMPDRPAPARFAFMPFGAGPRVCVGAQFAMAEAVLVLAALIGRFHVARVDDRPVLPVGIVTTQPDYPADVVFRPRG